MKNKASETINKIIPKFNPFCTANVWFPKYVPSLIISLNQNDIENTTPNKAPKNRFAEFSKLCIHKAALTVSVNKLKLVFSGQGEGETK
jgi:hypothetical protein